MNAHYSEASPSIKCSPNLAQNRIKEAAQEIVSELNTNREKDEVLLMEFKNAVEQQLEKTLTILKKSLQTMHVQFGQELESKMSEYDATMARIVRLEDDIRSFDAIDKSRGETAPVSPTPEWEEKSAVAKKQIHDKAQDIVDEMKRKREEDETMLHDFKTNVVKKVKESIVVLQQSMQCGYVRSSEQLDEKMTELFHVLERCDKL